LIRCISNVLVTVPLAKISQLIYWIIKGQFMRFTRVIRTRLASLFLLFLPLLLTACGGESSGSSTPNSGGQPTQIAQSNWTNNNLRAKSGNSSLSVDDLGDRLKITITYPNIVAAENTQIFIDSDNNKQTGFNFDDEAWGLIGADYIIENRTLFKSLSNNSDWNWNANVPQLDSFSKTANVVEAVINKSKLGNPCTSINVGVMGLNDSWDIEVMYPISNALATMRIQSCGGTGTDTIKPVILLHGSNPMSVVKGETFYDPGAVASDNVDGDISASITVSGAVNTNSIGTYTLTYRVADSAGNVANLNRVVNVINPPTSNGITVDGNMQDWDALASSAYSKLIQTSSKTFLATEDAQKNNIYLLAKWTQLNANDNLQVYLDTDNNINTGYQFWDDDLDRVVSGAEYFIENGTLNKYTGANGYEWRWQYNAHPMEYVHNGSTVEMKLPSSIVTATKLDMTVYRVDSSWSNFQLFADKQVYSTSGGVNPGPVKKFSHVKIHNELLNNQSIVWGERGSYDDSVQSLNITSRANKGSSSFKVTSTDELHVNQLLVYQSINGNYYIAQIRSMPDSRTINLVEPLEEAVTTGTKAWNFYANTSHPNRYGYRAIADFMVQSQNMDASTTGRHILLGDSWFDQPNYLEARLNQKLPLATIINSGVGGNTVQDLVNRFDSDVTPNNPDTIWILSGTNDYWQGVTAAQYKNSMQTLINKSKAIGVNDAKVIIIDSSVGAGTGATGVENHMRSDEYVNAVIELY